ncbi:hypothetical protein C5167_021368 [Papaver somniferum]|uniref:Uncharacterized protein n=1 Tax=Papaver somniferum TaxID=3469 RepID=A0A4Y7IZ10_PAPSO|nr:hypothetical protein C5167_021368 [Papaver somniferum]
MAENQPMFNACIRPLGFTHPLLSSCGSRNHHWNYFYRQGIYWETSQHPAHVRIGFDTVEKLKFEFENCFIMEAASWHRLSHAYKLEILNMYK